MEVDNEHHNTVAEDEETELLLQDHDADEFRDEMGEEQDHNEEDVERLLGEDANEEEQEQDDQKEEEDASNDETKERNRKYDSDNSSTRGRGGSSMRRSGFRGRSTGPGLLGRGPPPHMFRPGFFMGPHPMLRPPLGGMRPPFMPPMMGMRGPMRPMMMRGRGGPMLLHSSSRKQLTPNSSSSEDGGTSKSSSEEDGAKGKPTPLMSIETPLMVKMMVDTKLQREREEELLKRQQVLADCYCRSSRTLPKC
jgi:hypothetical protein